MSSNNNNEEVEKFDMFIRSGIGFLITLAAFAWGFNKKKKDRENAKLPENNTENAKYGLKITVAIFIIMLFIYFIYSMLAGMSFWSFAIFGGDILIFLLRILYYILIAIFSSK